MGYYLAIPILLFSTALQSSILPAYGLYNGQLELSYVLIAAWAVNVSWEEAVFWAFAGGIMQDMLGIAPLGTSSIGMLITVFAIKWFASRVFRFNVLFLIGFIAAGTFMCHVILFVVLAASGYVPNSELFFIYFSLPTAALNIAATLPLYLLVRLVQARIPRAQSAWEVRQR